MVTPIIYKENWGRVWRMRPGERKLDGYGRNKFYNGRAGVTECDGVLILRSYDTLFAAAFGGKLAFLSCLPVSRTTGRHIAAFAEMANATSCSHARERRKIPILSVENNDPEAIAWYVKRQIG